jgi:hypothetical protein
LRGFEALMAQHRSNADTARAMTDVTTYRRPNELGRSNGDRRKCQNRPLNSGLTSSIATDRFTSLEDVERDIRNHVFLSADHPAAA